MQVSDLPETVAFLVRKPPEDWLVTFRTKSGAEFLPVFHPRIDWFNQWADSGGKRKAQERGVPSLFLMAEERETFIAKLKALNRSIELHFNPVAGELETPAERRLTISKTTA